MKKMIIVLCMISGVLVSGSVSRAAPQEGGEAPAAQARITLEIKGMDVVDVLKMLAGRSGMNIAVGKNVSGRVTLFLKDVLVDEAFEIVILSNDLAYEKTAEVVNVMTQRDYELVYGERYKDKRKAKIMQLKYAKAADVARAVTQIKTAIGKIVVDEGSNTIVLVDTPEKLQQMEEFIASTDLPTRTEIFKLNYAQSDKLQAKLQEAVTKGIGSLRIDERTNQIAVTDYPEKLKEIAAIIEAFDEKTLQVLIDAQIVEIKPSDKFEMGVDWDYWIKKHFKASAALPIATGNTLFIGTPAIATSAEGDYKAIIDILRTIGDTKILSSPRIMALSNQEAKILVGTKEAYITSATSQAGTGTAVTSQTVNFVDVGIKLYVTPTASRDGFVTMKIKPEISSAIRTNITSEGVVTQVPIVTTSEAETTVMIKDGVTIIIGGLRKDQRTKTVKKIPGLGDIPLLGFLFRSTSDEVQKTELVILLTPHIVSGESSRTEFAHVPPRDGAVAEMVNGNIVINPIRSGAPRSKSVSDPAAQLYYLSVMNHLDRFLRQNAPKGKAGSVGVSFSLYSDGVLTAEPQAFNATDPVLIAPALAAVKEAQPFPAFPPELRKGEETFRLEIGYNQAPPPQ